MLFDVFVKFTGIMLASVFLALGMGVCICYVAHFLWFWGELNTLFGLNISLNQWWAIILILETFSFPKAIAKGLEVATKTSHTS